MRLVAQNGASTKSGQVYAVMQQGLRSAMGLRRVGKRYGPNRTEAGGQLALSYGGRIYKTVERMLKLGRERDHEVPQTTHFSFQRDVVTLEAQSQSLMGRIREMTGDALAGCARSQQRSTSQASRSVSPSRTAQKRRTNQ